MKDYVSLTSYTHHPFYESFVLEVQDNWAMQQSYNLPLDELMMVMEEAIMNGYTFAWGADVSEKGFLLVTHLLFFLLMNLPLVKKEKIIDI